MHFQAALAMVRARHPFLAVRADWDAGRLEPADSAFPCTEEVTEGIIYFITDTRFHFFG